MCQCSSPHLPVTCSGGIKLTFTGQYLNVSQQPRLQFNNGLQSTTVSIIQYTVAHTILVSQSSLFQVMCQKQSSSGTTLVCIAPPLSVQNSYTVVMDAAPGPENLDSNLKLSLAADPKVLQLKNASRRVYLGVNDSTISIEVSKV